MTGSTLVWVSQGLRVLALVLWSLGILAILRLFAKKYATYDRMRLISAAIFSFLLGLMSEGIRRQ